MIRTNPVRRVEGLFLEDYSAAPGEYLGARIEEAFTRNPLPSIGRMQELSEAAGLSEELAEINRGMGLPERPEIFRRELSPLLSAEEATARGEAMGLKFSKPTRAEVVDIMARRKRAEVTRQSIMRRSPGGFGLEAGALGLDLLVTAADPLNVAAAFIPVVREARFAAWAARFGPTAARFGRGGIEGAFGATLLEPVVLAAATQEQADYDMMDSLLNVAFGTALGGGLHVGGGALADAISRRTGAQTLSERLSQAPHEVREAALRTAVAQAIEGKRIDIGPLLDDPLMGLEQPRGLSLADAPSREFSLGEFTGRGPSGRYQNYTPLTAGDRRFVEGVVEEVRASQPGHRLFLETEGQGSTPEVIGVKSTMPDFVRRANEQAEEIRRERARIRKENEKRPDGQKRPLPEAVAPITRETVERVGRKLLDNKPLGKAEAGIAQELVGEARVRREVNARDMLAFREGRAAEDRASLDAIAAREAEGYVARQASPQAIDLADFRAAERAEEIMKQIPVDETAEVAEDFLEDAAEQADGLRLALGISDEEFAKVFAELDEAVAEAQALGKAARAAALCDLRT